MPATSNFKTFNPDLQNSETDSQYASDVMRTGGAVLDALLPSPLFNKFAHQVSMFPAAFCQMLANKGFSTSDADFNNLVSVLSNVKTGADFTSPIVVVPYATAVTFDASVAAEFDLTLSGNVSASSLVKVSIGQMLTFIITQDAIGGRTLSWPANMTYPGPICALPNSTSIQMFVVRPNGMIAPVTPMIQISGGLIVPPLPSVVSVSASGDISSANKEVFEKVNASAGAVSRNIFTAAGFSGFKVHVKKTDTSANAVTVQPKVAGQTIDGFPSVSIAKYNDSLSMMSDGANWFIF